VESLGSVYGKFFLRYSILLGFSLSILLSYQAEMRGSALCFAEFSCKFIDLAFSSFEGGADEGERRWVSDSGPIRFRRPFLSLDFSPKIPTRSRSSPSPTAHVIFKKTA